MFNETVLGLSLDARHEGRLEDPTHQGLVGLPGEGAFVWIQVCAEGGIVFKARFETYTCPAARASCELLCRLIENSTFEKSKEVSGKDLIALMRGLPEGKEHLPSLAVEALNIAIASGNARVE